MYVQMSRLQQQLTDARSENNELISRLRDWNVSPSASPAVALPLPNPRLTAVSEGAAAFLPADVCGATLEADRMEGGEANRALPSSSFEDRMRREALEGELREALARASAAEAECAALQV